MDQNGLERFLENDLASLHEAKRDLDKYLSMPDCKLTTQRINAARTRIREAKTAIWMWQYLIEQMKKEKQNNVYDKKRNR